MTVFPPKKKVGGPHNDWFFDIFDRGMDLPRSRWVWAGTGVVLLTLILLSLYVLTNLGVI